MQITLYSTGCPRCKVLEAKLDKAGISYDTFNDVDKMIEMGISTVPMLNVEGEMMNFSEAVKWINERN